MNIDRRPLLQQTKIRGVVDLVFCLDVTGSMGPCLRKLKESIGAFVRALEEPWLDSKRQVAVSVADYRVRVVGFRDLNVLDQHPALINDHPFVEDPASFALQLEDPRLRPKGGGGDGPESALDAIYLASRDTQWRQNCQRFIVTLTDAVPLPLHSQTVGDGMPRDIPAVVQMLNGQAVQPVIFGPDCPEFERVRQLRPSIAKASRLFPSYAAAQEFFKGPMEPFEEIMMNLAQTISQSVAEL